MKESILTGRERLYVAQALYKAVSEVVSTKGDGLRAQEDAELLSLYEAEGVKSLDAKVNGVKVGTYSVTVAKGSSKSGLETVDEDALRKWARENGYVREEIDYGAIEDLFRATGEVPDGCEPYTVTTAEHARGTVLRIDPAKVVKALSTSLPVAVESLLEGEVM